jgi:Pyruvate/2-oxoacid:ferredoxin oxidoreductase gamma subunit
MQGAIRRMEREAQGVNLQAYNTAALTGAAMAGKLPKFETVFRPRIKSGKAQPAQVLEANLRALARAWGAT